jgi:hypothetical protein
MSFLLADRFAMQGVKNGYRPMCRSFEYQNYMLSAGFVLTRLDIVVIKELMKEEKKSNPGCRQWFWEVVPLEEMTASEWEALCDRCGRCCLQKLEDEATGCIYYTDIACRLLDVERCICRNYANRFQFVPQCLQMTPRKASTLQWLPSTCAYRRLAEGKPLQAWHPLISNNPESVHEAGISVRGRVVSEQDVASDQMEDHIIDMDDNEPFNYTC